MRGRSSHISSGRRRAMKRHLVLGAVLAALVGTTATSWAVDIKMGGDYRLRGFYTDNLTDGNEDLMDTAAYYSSRFMMTTTATQDGVSGVVTLLAGSDNRTGNRLLGDPDTSFGPDDSVVELLEAYIKADFKTWALTAGRSGLKFGNGVILDDWVDGIWANLGLGGMDLTLGTAKLIENTQGAPVTFIGDSGPGTGQDTDLYFVNAGLGKMGMTNGTNLFLLYLNDRCAVLVGGGDEATVWTIGAATDLDMNGIKLKAEFDYLNGTSDPGDIDIKGYNLVVGAKLDAGGIPLGLDLVYTSGQDPTAAETNVNGFSGNYPLGIILTNSGAKSFGVTDGTCLSVGGGQAYTGGADSCVGGDGLMAIKVSSGLTHGDHVVDVAAIWARSTEEPVAGGEEDFGIELDGTVTWALTKNLSWLAGVGYLLAGDYWESVAGETDNPMILMTQLGYTF